MTRAEAIETIKKNMPSEKSLLVYEALETLIPELKESEDERIRKALCDIVRDMPYMETELRAHGLTVEKTLAYLEKQKEHKSVEHFDLTTLIVPAKLPKEQKPAEYLDKDKVFAIMTKLNNLSFSTRIPIDSDEYKKIDEITSDVLKLLDYPIKQKPAEWSEEDEKMRASIVMTLAGFMGNEDKISWLNSLRPQKKCSDCAKNIEGYIHGRSDAENKLLEQFGAIITPEGELRMKPQWRPSKEQMEALDEYIWAKYPNTEKYSKAVLSLRDDLKKQI